MYCRKCGGVVKLGDKFCKHCGQELKLNTMFILIQWFRKNFTIIFIVLSVILIIVIISVASSNKSTVSDKIVPSIVNIVCVNSDSDLISGGSGTIFSEEGLILTNEHVVANTAACLVTIPNIITGVPNEMYLAKPLIASTLSKQYDIAFVEITKAYVDENGKSYGIYPKKFTAFTNSDICRNYNPKLGDSVRIYGYPVTSGGYNLTITDGIISSFTEDGFILTSAKVDSGNSGGLVTSKDGCFIGIPSAIKTGKYQNLGVIIPMNIILEFLNQIQSS